MTPVRHPRHNPRTQRSAGASPTTRRHEGQRQQHSTKQAQRPNLSVHTKVRVSPRIRFFSAVTFVFVAVFSSLFLQSQLIAGQKHLDEINTGISNEIALERELRQAQAEAQAPHHIVSQAESMGLVKAESAIPLLPPGVGE